MSALQYAGSSGTDPKELATKRTVDTGIGNTAPNQQSVKNSVTNAISGKAKKDDVDQRDLKFAPADEFKKKDTDRNIPKTSLNQPNGPVSLGNDGKLNLTLFSQQWGSGYVMGPYGWQATYYPSSSGSAVLIGTLTTDVIPAGKKFWPLAYGQALVLSGDTGGKPLVEIRTGGGMLLATGRGRSMFTGPQGIAALPASDTSTWITSNGGSLSVNMWMSDLNGRPFTTTSAGGSAAISGAVYILLAG